MVGFVKALMFIRYAIGVAVSYEIRDVRTASGRRSTD